MNCPQCGVPIRAGQSFCGQCGATLQMAAGQTSPVSSAVPPSPSISGTIAFTTQVDDYWRLGALALLLISTFIPAVSLPGGLAFSVIQLGVVGVLAILIILALAAVTAIPSWRPSFWGPLERFLSAALVGNVFTVFLLVVTVASVVSRLMAKLSQSAGGLGSLLLGSTTSLAIHVGFGLVLALIGSIGWAVVTRRHI